MDIRYKYDITARNTFRMKVSCSCFVEYDSPEDLCQLYFTEEYRSALPKPFLHIGGGSNLLFTNDFPGTILHSNIRFIEECASGAFAGGGNVVFVEVGAGVVFDDFCSWAAEKGLWGSENLSYIPGEVGAAAVQNIGAYGVEIKDIVEQVKCFDVITGNIVAFRCNECGYGYRTSLFKTDRKGRYIVTSVVFRLNRDASPNLGYGHLKAAVEAAAVGDITPQIIRDVIIGIRRDKLPEPSETGSAGSFFKNPVVPKSAYDKVVSIAELELGKGCNVPYYDMGSGFVKIPAAWLIERCGWKGVRSGNAGVYEKQPLVIVNATGEASPDEIIDLENRIVVSVKEKFDIELHPEVEHV